MIGQLRRFFSRPITVDLSHPFHESEPYRLWVGDDVAVTNDGERDPVLVVTRTRRRRLEVRLVPDSQRRLP